MDLEERIMARLGCTECPHYFECFDDNFEPCDDYLDLEEQMTTISQEEKEKFWED